MTKQGNTNNFLITYAQFEPNLFAKKQHPKRGKKG